MLHAATSLVLGGFVVLGGSAAVAATPVFETWPEDVTTATEPESSATNKVPVWWDVTLDGHPDLVFFSPSGVERLYRHADGTIAVAQVSTSTATSIALTSLRGWVFAPIDADGDGVDELLIIGRAGALLRVTGEDTIDIAPLPLPAFTARDASDASVGDLNRDGLPDVYVAIGGKTRPERLNPGARPDVILMNRGGGRFEAVEATPTRHARTHGVVLADIDGDGWLDAVESVDYSWITGPSRLLLNRTQDGDSTPTFEASEHRWDPGTDGMGVAVADIDADGHLDMYNTSWGHDLLVMGLGDGQFRDETYERGVLHRWASLGVRIQWSPTFVDMNADGRLDLLVRHGIREYGLPGIGDGLTHSVAADLLYLQDPDGTFRRVEVPFLSEPGNGIRFAVGDLEGDGLPDAARDGRPGTTFFWGNATAIEPTTRRLTVRLAPTVSGSPPTGAIVEGACGGTTHLRHITSGGKMGATAAYEAHLAWPDCANEAVGITVTWPSGAVTVHEVPVGETLSRLEEPRWFQPGAGGVVVLDPAGVGAVLACMASDVDEATCCNQRCEVSRPATGPAWVRLDDRAATSLPPREASWLLVTTPHLPRPGEETTVHVQHVGAPETFPGTGAGLHHDGVEVPWATVDEATRTLSAVVLTGGDATSLPLTLSVDEVEVAAWSPSVGMAFDSLAPWLDLYPVRAVGTSLEDEDWEVHVHTMPGVFQLEADAVFTLSTLDGVEVPVRVDFAETDLRRIKLTASWDDLTGVDTLLIRDHASGSPISVPVVQPTDSNELLDLIGSAECGLMAPRVGLGSRVDVILTLRDKAGHPMLAPTSLIDLEVQGAALSLAPWSVSGMKDMRFHVVSDETTGPGHVIVRSALGDELGRCDFTVVPWPAQPIDVARSWATLSQTELDRAASETTRLRIGLVNDFGELSGADTWPTVGLGGGTWTSPLVVTDAGTLAGDIGPSDESDTIIISVSISGEIVESFTVNVTGEAPTDEPTPASGGCAGGDTHRHLALLVAALLALAFTRRPSRIAPSSPS